MLQRILNDNKIKGLMGFVCLFVFPIVGVKFIRKEDEEIVLGETVDILKENKKLYLITYPLSR